MALKFRIKIAAFLHNIEAPGAGPQALCFAQLYLRPHQVIDRLCPVVIRRNRPHIGIATVLAICAERPAGVVPLAVTGVDCQIAVLYLKKH